MLQSISHRTTMAQVPLQVAFSPSFILQQQGHEAGPVLYDAGLGVLTYHQSREPAGPPMQFVFPTTVDGHAITAEVESAAGGGQVAVEGGQIFLPVLGMYQRCTIQLTFAPPAATEGKVAKTKMKIDITVRPTGGG